MNASTISIMWALCIMAVLQKSSKKAARLGNSAKSPIMVIAPKMASPDPKHHQAIAHRTIINEQKLKKGVHFNCLLSHFIRKNKLFFCHDKERDTMYRF